MSEEKQLSTKQKQAARMIVYGETKEAIAKQLELTTRSVYRWSNLPVFKTEIERLQNTETKLSADEAWKRLSPKERERMAKMVSKENRKKNDIDIEDELASIMEKTKDFRNKMTSENEFQRMEKSLNETAVKVCYTYRRIICLYSGEDPDRKIPDKELLQRYEQLVYLMKKRLEKTEKDKRTRNRNTEQDDYTTFTDDEDELDSDYYRSENKY